jgi:hypothetical protein
MPWRVAFRAERLGAESGVVGAGAAESVTSAGADDSPASTGSGDFGLRGFRERGLDRSAFGGRGFAQRGFRRRGFDASGFSPGDFRASEVAVTRVHFDLAFGNISPAESVADAQKGLGCAGCK